MLTVKAVCVIVNGRVPRVPIFARGVGKVNDMPERTAHRTSCFSRHSSRRFSKHLRNVLLEIARQGKASKISLMRIKFSAKFPSSSRERMGDT